MATKKKEKIKFDGKDIVEIGGAIFITKALPEILNAYRLKKGEIPYVDMKAEAVGLGGGMALGYLLKNNLMVNTSIATTGASVASGYLMPSLIDMITGTQDQTSSSNNQDKADKKKSTSGYSKLAAYISDGAAGMVTPYNRYKSAY